ncbi:AraC family transcriptional regulator [Pendulispora albinea]|uniref:AraC family transcriptional regulator n=1 Tax=Pendulispora albinea TaxID=2741071 RepID=A0ABZ2LRE8_9BACT
MASRYWRLDRVQGVDLLRSDASTHRYARHSHEGYALGVVEAGAHAFAARGRVWTAVPGCVIIVNPDDPHDGGPADRGRAYSYRMIYVDGAVLRGALDEAAGRRTPVPFFAEPIVHDPALARRLVRLHRAFDGTETTLEREARLLTALVELAQRHGKAPAAGDPKGGSPRDVALALAYLSENFAEDCSLAQLSALAGVDRFHLLRAFRRCLGMPPHLYQTQLRLRHAKRLLLTGASPAMAAVASGFADQSHLIRKFKAAYGVTPGEYLGRHPRRASSARPAQYPGIRRRHAGALGANVE